MNRLSCDTRTRSGAPFLEESRYSQGSYFSMTWMNRIILLRISRNELPAGSRRLRLKQLFSGLGEVVE